MRLESQDHEVLLTGVLDAVGRLDISGDGFAAILPNQLQAVPLDRRQMGPSVDHGHVFAGQRELGAQETAYGTGAHDTDLQRLLPGRIALAAPFQPQRRSDSERARPGPRI